MPNWNQIQEEIQQELGKETGHDPFSVVRHRYLSRLHNVRQRNIVSYHSAFLQRPSDSIVPIGGQDLNGLMNAMHGLDKSKGLDFIIHTGGGDTMASEAIANYMQNMFSDIDVFVPTYAMSGGTLIACAANRIIMGKHSNLGPTDPQLFRKVAANTLISEFRRAQTEIVEDEGKFRAWSIILKNYDPSLVELCMRVLDSTKENNCTSVEQGHVWGR